MTAVEPYVEHWAARIRPHLTRAVESIVAAGRELAEAKNALPYGEVGPLLAELSLGWRTADRFMAIAAHPILSNSTQWVQFPPSWRTLYELTKVPDERLVEAIETGAITPSTTRSAVQKLIPTEHVQREVPLDLDDARRRLLIPDGLGPAVAQMDDDVIDAIAAIYASRLAIGSGARWLVRRGTLRMPPSWWNPAKADDALDASNRLVEWRLRVEWEAGDFLNTCDDIGITIDGGAFVLPDNLLRDRDVAAVDLVALGYFTFWWFTPAELAELTNRVPT